MDWKRIAKKTGRCLAIGTAGIVLFSALVLGLAQTESGKRLIVKWISKVLSHDAMKRVEVERLSGFVPFDFHVGSIVFWDEEGRWLTVRDLSIRWSPASLIRGVLLIEDLQVSLIELHRMPEQEREGETSPRDFLRGLRAASRIRIQHLAAPRIALGERVLGEPALFRLEGRTMVFSRAGERESFLSLERLDETAAKVVIAASLKGEEPFLSVQVEAEEAPGGIFARMLQTEGPITLRIEGDGPLQSWGGQFSAHVGRMGGLRSSVMLRAEDEISLCANGVLELTEAGILQDVSALLGSKIHFDFEVRKDREGGLRLDGFTLKADSGLSVQLAASMSEERKNSEGQFRICMDDLSRLGGSLDFKLTGRLSVTGNFAGPLLKPETTIDVDLQELEFPMARIGRIQGRFGLEFLGRIGARFPGFRLLGKGDMENIILRRAAAMEERRVTWQLALEGPTREMVLLRRLELAGESGVVDLCGELDFRGPKGSLDISVNLFDFRSFSAFLGFELPGNTSLVANVSGDARERFLLTRFEGKTTVLNELVPSLTPLLGQEVVYGGKIALRDGKRVTLSDFRVSAPAGSVSGTAVMDVPTEEFHADWTLKMPDLGGLSFLLQKTITGSLEAGGEIRGSLRAMNAKAKATAEALVVNGVHMEKATAIFCADDLSRSKGGELSWEILLAAHKMHGKADIALKKNRFVVSRIMMKGVGALLEGNVALHLDRTLVDGVVSVRSEDFSELSRLLGEQIEGNLQMKVRLTSAAGQEISFDIKGRDLKGRSAEVSRVRIQGRIHDVFRAPQGTATVQVREVRLEEGRFEFLDLKAEGGLSGIRFTMHAKGHYREDFHGEAGGALAVSQDVMTLTLDRFRAAYDGWPLSLARSARVERSSKGLEVEGAELKLGEGYLKGSAGFSEDSFHMRLRFERLPVGVFSMLGIWDLTGTVAGSIRAAGPFRAPEGVVELHASGLGFRGPELRTVPPAELSLSGRIRRKRLDFQVELRGVETKPLEAKLELPIDICLSPFFWTVRRQDKLRGSLSGEIGLLRVSPILGLGRDLEGQAEMNLVVEGTLESPEISMEARVEKAVYGDLGIGTATVKGRLLGTTGQPQGNVEIHLQGLELLGPRFSRIPPMTLQARGKLDQDRLFSELLVTGLQPKPFEAILELPLRLSILPFSCSLPGGGQMEGSFSGRVDLSHIMTLSSLDDQDLTGKLQIHAFLKGTVKSPVFSGRALMDQGRYENFRTGTVLRDLQVEISAEKQRLSIGPIRASDGAGGTVKVAGWVDLVPAEHFPFNLKFILDRVKVLRLDNATASAGGTLSFSGSLLESLLTGELLVGPAEFQIPDQLPPEITEVKVIEINRKEQETRMEGKAGRLGNEVNLDVSISSPGRVFVRGRGLDSEWQGKVEFKGKVKEPVITGSLSVVRGTFNFLGKSFALKKGVIDFAGGYPALPQVDVLAEARRKDLTVQLEITGFTRELVVNLSSEPHLPRDEILSQLLFGRNVTGISPLQAAQLATALNTLAGGGGFDWMGSTRRILGVDHLEVKTTGEKMEDTKISAGKYLGDKVYIEVERGLGPESGKASVQLEITPNINVETEMGTNAEGGVGVNWKWDY